MSRGRSDGRQQRSKSTESDISIGKLARSRGGWRRKKRDKVILGVLIGGLIIAMYLPIFQLGAVV